MLKSLFTGALFGFGFALALLFVFVIYAEAFFPERFEEPLQPEPAVAPVVDPLSCHRVCPPPRSVISRTKSA